MSEQLLKEILSEVQSIRSEQEQTNERIEALESEQQFIKNNMATKEDVSEIAAIKVAVLENLEFSKKMQATLASHEQTLNLLSRRSIDQEAKLKQIKYN